jgi:hypothetical protein
MYNSLKYKIYARMPTIFIMIAAIRIIMDVSTIKLATRTPLVTLFGIVT